MTLDEIAAELRMTSAEMRRRWRRMHLQSGFPRPLPIPGRRAVWSRALVVAWIRGAGLAAAPANDDRPGVDAAALFAAQRSALTQELGGQQGG